MSNHTPGPYHINKWNGMNGEQCVQVEAFDETGNRTLAVRIDGTSDPQFYEANSRLFQQAPALLAALKRLAQAARDADLGYLDPAMNHAFDVIEAAAGAA